MRHLVEEQAVDAMGGMFRDAPLRSGVCFEEWWTEAAVDVKWLIVLMP